ncbi:MAG: ACP S-malonyltransferase [Phycisphaerales bacterium]|jgi:[acyl-carrier-protein] S-malonyltransferase
MSDSPNGVVLLCPGQGAQQVGMGKAWADACPAAAQTFAAADKALAGLPALDGRPLSELCFEGPIERLGRTDVSQPALFACAVASWQAMLERMPPTRIVAAAGLSLGEYTALHLAGAFSFVDGLRLVALRGRLMQEAAEASRGSMVALIGADESQAEEICREAAGDGVLVCANFNAPGQIVLSGDVDACGRAVEVASAKGVRATPLQVAGAFHSPLMQPAADGLAKALEEVEIAPLRVPVWSNVTARPHQPDDAELLRKRLVEQLISPVRWSQACSALLADFAGDPKPALHELAPGSVLRGLMRRIDRSFEVTSHDQPPAPTSATVSN